MKFAHLADCHLGSWRDPKLSGISTKAFTKAVDHCIRKEVDFVLIAGDLFNTSLPSIDCLKEAVIKLKGLKDKNIPVYVIPGSHDFSPTGKTMLDVLENAGLVTNVAKGNSDEKITLQFTTDPKTGAKITGMLGKKGGLEKDYYEHLDRESLENEQGFKIFMFHTMLTEFKTVDKMDSAPLSVLPKNFNYYAGGHPHTVFQREEKDYGLLAYPGPLFPNNFKELEELGNGGFFIVEDQKATWQPILVYTTFPIKLDCNNLTPVEIEEKIEEKIKDKEFYDTIVTLRLSGCLKSGKITDINFRDIFSKIYGKSAYFVMKNTSSLTTKDFEQIKIDTASVEDIESSLVKEHLGQSKLFDKNKEEQLTHSLISALNTEKQEGETVSVFEKRISDELANLLNL
ncbi:MAG: DNA repair exonuclease [bacterium]|nr:DNA repair exonuclease [bacterium]